MVGVGDVALMVNAGIKRKASDTVMVEDARNQETLGSHSSLSHYRSAKLRHEHIDEGSDDTQMAVDPYGQPGVDA